MPRRCFDHLHAELSVEIGSLIPRYPLWLRVQEAGFDPDAFETVEVMRFVDEHLDGFLRDEGLSLSQRRQLRLRRRLRRFDPSVPTPYETMQRIFGPSA